MNRRSRLSVRFGEIQELLQKIDTENEQSCHSGPIRELLGRLKELIVRTEEEF